MQPELRGRSIKGKQGFRDDHEESRDESGDESRDERGEDDDVQEDEARVETQFQNWESVSSVVRARRIIRLALIYQADSIHNPRKHLNRLYEQQVCEKVPLPPDPSLGRPIDVCAVVPCIRFLDQDAAHAALSIIPFLVT